MATLTAKTGEPILIDDADHARLSCYAWSLNGSGYPQSSLGLLHRVIAGARKGEYVDHANVDKLDCRRANLRLCRQSQNLANRRKLGSNRSSQFKGVYWEKKYQKWRARITSRQSGRLLHLGYFTDEVQAAKSYDEAARAQYGVFALTNFEVGT